MLSARLPGHGFLLEGIVIIALAGCGDDDPGAGGAATTTASTVVTSTTGSSSTSTASAASTTPTASVVASSSSGAMVCVPGMQEPCYGGPSGTQDVGTCHGGIQTCRVDGSGFDACEGEVLPVMEICGNAEDENCDGTAEECPVDFAIQWGHPYPFQVLALDGSDNLFLTGAYGFFGADLGGGAFPPTPAGSGNAFLVKMDAQGNHLWSRSSMGTAPGPTGAWATAPTGMATGPDGSAVVVGRLEGTTDFGGGPLTSVDFGTIFLVKYDADGNHVFSKVFGTAGYPVATGIAVDSAGNIVLTGIFGPTLDFGGGPMTSGLLLDGFLVKLNGAGDFVWGKRFGDDTLQEPEDVTVDAQGNIYVTGSYEGTIDLGDGPHTATGKDIFVSKLDPDGTPFWTWTRGGPGAQGGQSLAVDSMGAVALAGRHTGMLDVGNGVMNGGQAFLLRLDANGNLAWVQNFDNMTTFATADLACDPLTDDIVWVGTVGDVANFGGGNLPNPEGLEAFVAGFSANGLYLYSSTFGGDLDQISNTVVVDDQHRIVVAGSFDGTIDFGAGPMSTAVNMHDSYLVALNPPL